MGFSRQEYWSGLLFPSPGDLPDSGIEPGLLTLQVDDVLSQPPEKPVVRKKCNENNCNCDRYFKRKVKPDKWSLCPHGASWGRIETRAKVSWLTKPSRNHRTDCNTSTQDTSVFKNFLLLLLEKLNFYFIFFLGCTESSLLCMLFSSCGKQGSLSSCCAWACRCRGFSCGAQAIGLAGFSCSR